MAKTSRTRVNKLQAAEIQLNTAIEMLFLRMHPVPVHTVAAASFRVLRDLAMKEKNPPRSLDFKTKIKPGKEGEFWKGLNFAANFFKHADKDADGTYEFSPEANDLLIFWAISVFRELTGGKFSDEMKTFLGWFMLQWPDLMIEGPMREFLEAGAKSIRLDALPRNLRLQAGHQAVVEARKKQEQMDRWPNLRVPVSESY